MTRMFIATVMFIIGSFEISYAEPLIEGDNRFEILSSENSNQKNVIRIANQISTIRSSGMLPAVAIKWPKAERESFLAFYAQRNDAPIWYGSDALDERRQALIEQLISADEDGLDIKDYPIPPANIDALDERKIAEADLMLSASAVAYARDARGARIDPVRLSKLITPKMNIPRATAILGDLIGAKSPALALASYQPTFEGYRLLKQKLAEFKDTTASITPTTISNSTLNKKPFRTNTAMVGAVAPNQFDIIANMERWRWLPAELGERHIFVNIPEFTLRLIDHGHVAHMTRAVVGKPDTATPIFSSMMQSLIINPSWHVPESIIRNEFLPKMAEDPNYAEKAGYEVTQNGETVSIRQPPGERNALGFVKFNLPNEHAVYLHDTPMRKLFGNAERAYSHGCVRVENPFALAAAVLADPRYPEDMLKALIGRDERSIKLAEPLPVHIAYFTLMPDETGQLRRFGDIYGYDQTIITALGLGQTKTYAALH